MQVFMPLFFNIFNSRNLNHYLTKNFVTILLNHILYRRILSEKVHQYWKNVWICNLFQTRVCACRCNKFIFMSENWNIAKIYRRTIYWCLFHCSEILKTNLPDKRYCTISKRGFPYPRRKICRLCGTTDGQTFASCEGYFEPVIVANIGSHLQDTENIASFCCMQSISQFYPILRKSIILQEKILIFALWLDFFFSSFMHQNN